MTAPSAEILRRETEALELRLAPEAITAACRDHFPGWPVLPGVALLDWAVALAAAHLGTPRAAGNVQVKFLHLVRPGAALTLRLAREGERIGFVYTADGAIAARGRFAP